MILYCFVRLYHMCPTVDTHREFKANHLDEFYHNHRPTIDLSVMKRNDASKYRASQTVNLTLCSGSGVRMRLYDAGTLPNREYHAAVASMGSGPVQRASHVVRLH